MTATIANYLIEVVGDRVDLCESQGNRWVTIRQDITRRTAEQYGFNLDSPAVQRVFDAANA